MTMAAARSDRVSANVTSRIAARPPTSTAESQPRESAIGDPVYEQARRCGHALASAAEAAEDREAVSDDARDACQVCRAIGHAEQIGDPNGHDAHGQVVGSRDQSGGPAESPDRIHGSGIAVPDLSDVDAPCACQQIRGQHGTE